MQDFELKRSYMVWQVKKSLGYQAILNQSRRENQGLNDFEIPETPHELGSKKKRAWENKFKVWKTKIREFGEGLPKSRNLEDKPTQTSSCEAEKPGKTFRPCLHSLLSHATTSTRMSLFSQHTCGTYAVSGALNEVHFQIK